MYEPDFLKRKKPIAEINIVPYVDVMLVLLIIFMVTAPLLSQGVVVELPQGKALSLPEKDKPPLLVSVNEKGQLFLNISDNPNTPMSRRDLKNRVSSELTKDPSRAVLVRGDKNVAYDKVLQAMVMLQMAGAMSVGLEVSPTDELS